ncbi:MAG: hypothetical protein U5M23_13045 [Marinagarivorans sp.]|nr:hypothetical protein [Marinagarivorans sp.]
MRKTNMVLPLSSVILALSLVGCGSGGGGTSAKPTAPGSPNEQPEPTFDKLKVKVSAWFAVSPPLATHIGGGPSMFAKEAYRGPDGMKTERPSDLIERYEKRTVYLDTANDRECTTSGNMTETGKPVLSNLNEFRKTDYNDCFTDFTFFGKGEMLFLTGSTFNEMTENKNIDQHFAWNLEPGVAGKYTTILTLESNLRIEDKDASTAINKNRVMREYTYIDGTIIESRIVNDDSAESTTEAKNYTLLFSTTEMAAGSPIEKQNSSASTLKTDSFIKKIVQTLDQTLYSVDGEFTLNDKLYTVKTITPIGNSGENVQGEVDITIGKEKINVLMLSPSFAKYSVDSDGNGTTDFSFDDAFAY